MRPAVILRRAGAAIAVFGLLPLGCGGGDSGAPPAPPAVKAQPQGVYTYATEGFERIGGPLPGRLAYPRTSTVTVERFGCDLTERWEARAERYAEWRYCVTDGSWRLRSVADYHEFFGTGQRRVYRCSGHAVPRPDRIQRGYRWTDRCRARRTVAVARGEALGRPRLRVGGAEIPAVHLRVRTRLGGDVQGAYTMDSWLRRADGLLLRRIFRSDSRADTIAGKVTAQEEYQLTLQRLTPERAGE